MRVIRSIGKSDRDPKSVVTVGTFDGVHRAHQEIIREVVHRARRMEGRAVVVTFDPHPKEIVQSLRGPVQLLSTIAERQQRLEFLGVDLLAILPFTYEFSRLSSHEFYERYIVHALGVSEVVVGYDHMFGRDREGGIQELLKIGQEFNFSVLAVHPLSVDGEIVSSTRIRKALAEGNLERARNLLGYSYSITGTVVRGDGRGKSLGFPTANVQPSSMQKILPRRGVYVAHARIRDRAYFGMLNIGVRPTVTEALREIVEIHLFDLSDDLYGEEILITFITRLRDERRFDSLEALVGQLHKDKDMSLQLIAGLIHEK
jgi:riboflavin kinase/FMN adenylyltransferase